MLYDIENKINSFIQNSCYTYNDFDIFYYDFIESSIYDPSDYYMIYDTDNLTDVERQKIKEKIRKYWLNYWHK